MNANDEMKKILDKEIEIMDHFMTKKYGREKVDAFNKYMDEHLKIAIDEALGNFKEIE